MEKFVSNEKGETNLVDGDLVACRCFGKCDGGRQIVMVPRAAVAIRPAIIYACPVCGESDWSVEDYE